MNESLIRCPHCGEVIDVEADTTPLLTYANLTVLHELRHFLRPGQQFNPSRVADRLHMTGPGLHYHLRFLRQAGYVVSWVPKGRTLQKWRMSD